MQNSNFFKTGVLDFELWALIYIKIVVIFLIDVDFVHPAHFT